MSDNPRAQFVRGPGRRPPQPDWDEPQPQRPPRHVLEQGLEECKRALERARGASDWTDDEHPA